MTKGTDTARGLSIRQPHAALIAAGVKRIETRSRATSYRGPVMIQAAAGPVPAEYVAGYYTPGRYAWVLEDVQPLPEPIPARGYPWLWRIEK